MKTTFYFFSLFILWSSAGAVVAPDRVIEENRRFHRYFQSETNRGFYKNPTGKTSLRLSYYVKGQGPVMLVVTPGWGPNAGLYLASLTRLEQRYTVIYFETRGAGASESPPVDKRKIINPKIASHGEVYNTNFDLDYFIDDMENLRKHLNINQWTIFGFSDGANLAMRYAARYPNRTQKLFLVNGDDHHGAGLASSNPIAKSYNNEIARIQDQNETRFSEKIWVKEPVSGKTMTARQMFQVAKQAMTRPSNTNEEFETNFKMSLPSYFFSLDSFRISTQYFTNSRFNLKATDLDKNMPDQFMETMPYISTPTIVIAGAFDPACPFSTALEMKKGIRNVVGFYVIPNAGHFSWLENPHDFWSVFFRH